MWRSILWIGAGCAGPGDGAGGAEGVPNVPVQRWVEERWQLPQVLSSLDLLFVVQDSCCVYEEVAAVVVGLVGPQGAFDQLLDAGVDVRLGVITTDTQNPEREGRLIEVGGRRFVDLSEAGAREHFAAMMDVGMNGSPDERGLRALSLALQEPLRSGWNAGFRRDEAGLQVVVISDEDDQSGQTPGVDEIVARLRDAQPDPALLSFSAVVATTDDCLPGDRAPRYLEVTRRLGGVAVDLCDDLVLRGGQTVTDLLQPPPEFFLRYVPYLPSLSMVVRDSGFTYDGVLSGLWDEVLERCETRSCFTVTYDPIRNSVRSDEYRFARNDDSEVGVRYRPISDVEPVDLEP